MGMAQPPGTRLLTAPCSLTRQGFDSITRFIECVCRAFLSLYATYPNRSGGRNGLAPLSRLYLTSTRAHLNIPNSNTVFIVADNVGKLLPGRSKCGNPAQAGAPLVGHRGRLPRV